MTAPKGRPTPKRSEATRKRGPVAPAPMTAAEAGAPQGTRRPKLSREERKAEQAMRRRASMSDRREKMMAGEDAYLLPRDKGPVRRYRARRGRLAPQRAGTVHARGARSDLRHAGGAVGQVQRLISPAMLVLVLIMVIDGFFLGRKVNRLVDEKFPDNTESGWKFGFYAASRASQLRRMRAPRPQVNRGDKVA